MIQVTKSQSMIQVDDSEDDEIRFIICKQKKQPITNFVFNESLQQKNYNLWDWLN